MTTMDPSNETDNPTPMVTYTDHHADTLTVYVPDFKQPALASALLSNNYTPCKTMFADADWITPDLRLNVESLFPSQDAITTGTRVRDKLAFKEACSVLFKKGRIFSSPKQLKQIATLFLDKWGGQCSQHGKKIVCYYHEVQKRTVKAVPLTSDRKVYNTKDTQKSQIKCPFEIRYSLIGRVARDKIPDICHETKITHTNFEHTCELSITYLREAKRLGGHVKLDIPALKTALDLLRLHPNTEARMLVRPYLVRALPNWQAFDAHYISNFRKRAIKHWSVHGDFDEEDSGLTLAEAQMLVSAPSAVDDTLDLDNECNRTNYEKLLRRVMQESSGTWKVTQYLEDCTAETPGFQFVINCDEEGMPLCITWATPRNVERPASVFRHHLLGCSVPSIQLSSLSLFIRCNGKRGKQNL
jgi:hypothetical protein